MLRGYLFKNGRSTTIKPNAQLSGACSRLRQFV
jgi:hypothetical protein